jgi:glutamine synthetase
MAVLREALGSDVFPRAYLAVKRAEAARFAGATLEEEVAALRDRY